MWQHCAQLSAPHNPLLSPPSVCLTDQGPHANTCGHLDLGIQTSFTPDPPIHTHTHSKSLWARHEHTSVWSIIHDDGPRQGKGLCSPWKQHRLCVLLGQKSCVLGSWFRRGTMWVTGAIAPSPPLESPHLIGRGAARRSLKQGSTNYGLCVKPRPLPVFVNKILLEHSHTPLTYLLSVAVFSLLWQSEKLRQRW